MTLTHEAYCALIGDKDCEIYTRNVTIERQTQQIEALEAHIRQLTSELIEREALLDKFAHHAQVPSRHDLDDN